MNSKKCNKTRLIAMNDSISNESTFITYVEFTAIYDVQVWLMTKTEEQETFDATKVMLWWRSCKTNNYVQSGKSVDTKKFRLQNPWRTKWKRNNFSVTMKWEGWTQMLTGNTETKAQQTKQKNVGLEQ